MKWSLLVLIMLLLFVGCGALEDLSNTLFYRDPPATSSNAETAVEIARPLIPSPWREAAVAVTAALATWWTAKKKLSLDKAKS
jgi:hypothetical protein